MPANPGQGDYTEMPGARGYSEMSVAKQPDIIPAIDAFASIAMTANHGEGGFVMRIRHGETQA